MEALTLTVGPDELAKLIGVCRKTVQVLEHAGRIPAPTRLGRRVFWSRSEVTEWVASGMPSRKDWELMRRRLQTA